MKSTLKIALHNYDGPMILASVSTDRDDLRDDVMNKFFSSLENSTDGGVTIDKGHLCFVEGFGRESSPESYVYTIHPIRPFEEVKYINRLQLSQAQRIIYLALDMFSCEDRQGILEKAIAIHNEHVASEKPIGNCGMYITNNLAQSTPVSTTKLKRK